MPLLPVSGIDHINMCVTSIERSIDFYCEVFGFEVKEDHRNDRVCPWVTLGIPGVAYLILYETEKARESRDCRIMHFGFALTQGHRMEDVLRRVLDAGLKTRRNSDGTPLVVHYGRSSSIYVRDPDDYEIDVSLKFGGGLDEN